MDQCCSIGMLSQIGGSFHDTNRGEDNFSTKVINSYVSSYVENSTVAIVPWAVTRVYQIFLQLLLHCDLPFTKLTNFEK